MLQHPSKRHYHPHDPPLDVFLCFFCELLFIPLSNSLLSRYQHTDEVHNSGVVWGRVSQVHAALLQQVEVTVSVATEWNHSQLPLATTRKITQQHIRIKLGTSSVEA